MRGTDGAFLTYTTRQSAEKAMLEHSSWVLINGENVKLLWGAHVIPKEAVIQTPPKDSRPLKVYARKRQRSNNNAGGGFDWSKQSNSGGEGPSLSKEGDGISKQLGEPSGEADAWGGKPNAGASSSNGSSW
ncbi:Uncharacterized protein Rs2_32509 [Raphanus sativus]|nr:Uncharacterized protein Rs2_32509 [Raphanus sativus]